MADWKSKLPQRFWDKVNIGGEDDCWEWTGGKTAFGYGMFRLDGKLLGAHVLSYRARHGGPLSSRKFHTDHLCRNPSCVNPNHLEMVTAKENLMRGNTAVARNSAKTHCIRGHEFTPENTIALTRGNGLRACRECSREINRRCRARKKAKMMSEKGQ